MKSVIEVSDLSKSYRISHQSSNKADYNTLKDDFANLLKKPLGKGQKDKEEIFWALKEVSFNVNQGEVFGIIGRNGSGKSTMLKILSRIIDPTSGKAIIHGRVASLLEVGTGFHPELTGRENIYFNGSMLGMSRQEIRRKFDEIVEFSEVEKFLDTPVKFYSSGMYVRLAFSVAAHLEPEILILDEVLSVGDAAFQQKSLRKILSTMEDGRTVLFVSHSMGAVRQLCSRGILLRDGKVAFMGETEELIEKYTEVMQEETPTSEYRTSWANDGSVDNDYFRPNKMYITDSSGRKIERSIKNNAVHWLCVEGSLKKVSELFNVGYVIQNTDTNANLYMSMSTDGEKESWPKPKTGKTMFRAKLPEHYLNAGNYSIKLVSSIHNKEWLIDPSDSKVSLELSISGGLSDSPFWKNPREGMLAPIIEWEIK